MRPYLAVIVDSFRAALASRILWVAFLAIWLLIAALAPIGYREVYTTQFRARDFYNGTQMKAMLAQGLVDPDQAPAAVRQLAVAMPADLKRQLRRVGEGDEVRIKLNLLADALNDLLDQESRWYDAEAWEGSLRLKELRQLEQTPEDELSESLRRRRARLRIEAALPGVFTGRSARSIALTYAGWDFPAHFEVGKTQFISLINQWVVPMIVNWLLGFLLVFLGILVTAHIVPDMLRAGSLHLLLSKPVSRTPLFLSKFVGGCAFVCLCVIQLVVGLYLVAGLRLDIWNIRMLWCIPVSVFLFAVFYSVSAVAGLRWRSPILAIGITCLFGLFCFVVGFIGGLFDGLVTRPDSIRHLVWSADTAIGATRGGGLVRWNDAESRWEEIVESDAMSFDRTLPPISLGADRAATAVVRNGRINPFGSGALDLLVMGSNQDWRPEPSLRLPTATTQIYRVGSNEVLAMSSAGLAITDRQSVLEAIGEPAKEDQRESDQDSEDGSEQPEEEGNWLTKLKNMMGGATEGFRDVLPKSVSIAPPRGLAVSPSGDEMVLLSRGRMSLLRRPPTSDSGPWQLAAEHQFDGDPSRKFVLAASDQTLMVAWPESGIDFLTSDSLEPIASVKLSSSLSPIDAVAVPSKSKPGDRFALLASDGLVRILHVSPEGEPSVADPLDYSDVESIAFDDAAETLSVVHDIDRVDVLEASSSFSLIRKLRPKLARWRWADRYLVTPLRTLTPQTGELGETIAAMVSGKEAVEIDQGAEQTELVRYNIVRPVASCAGFMLVMLTLGCVYFARRDF